jgi:hypothetical protein
VVITNGRRWGRGCGAAEAVGWGQIGWVVGEGGRGGGHVVLADGRPVFLLLVSFTMEKNHMLHVVSLTF